MTEIAIESIAAAYARSAIFGSIRSRLAFRAKDRWTRFNLVYQQSDITIGVNPKVRHSHAFNFLTAASTG